jgi:hypothetical protein
MDLFRDDQPGSKKVEKNEEAEAEKAKREREFEDQYTMRFENAAGRSGFKEKPWYSKIGDQSTEEGKMVDEEKSGTFGENKDVWGNPDPRRNEREKARLNTNDPLTMMKRAQQQLKQSENDKRKWHEQRDRETKESKTGRHRKSEKKHRRERNQYSDGLEGLRLDTKARNKPDEERVSRHNHRSNRSRESENDSDHNTPHRHHHRRTKTKSKSRSTSRDKREKRHHKHRRHYSESY